MVDAQAIQSAIFLVLPLVSLICDMVHDETSLFPFSNEAVFSQFLLLNALVTNNSRCLWFLPFGFGTGWSSHVVHSVGCSSELKYRRKNSDLLYFGLLRQILLRIRLLVVIFVDYYITRHPL